MLSLCVCGKVLYVKFVCVKLLEVKLLYVKVLHVKFVCVKLLYGKCACVREAAGGGGEGGGGTRDTESKTRTPHKDVGNKPWGYFPNSDNLIVVPAPN